MLKNLLVIFSLIFLASCGKKEVEERLIDNTEYASQVLRWMDRDIYLASASGNTSENTELQKRKLNEYLGEFLTASNLGENYFNFIERDSSLLNPYFFEDDLLPEKDIKSFILLWDDAHFDSFINERFNGNVPDLNAITITHSKYKRKFYMILRASCFSSDGFCKLNVNGTKALLARQLGLLVDLSLQDCTGQLEAQDMMCPINKFDTAQWDEGNLKNYLAIFNNRLDVVKLNPNYYGDYNRLPSVSRQWMDNKIYFAYSSSNPVKNNTFQKEKIKAALRELENNSILGSGYFSFDEVAETEIEPILEATGSQGEFKSFIQIYPDDEFSQFWQDIGGDEDVNAIVFVNSAHKKRFWMILRASCFATHDNCNGISSEEGLRALVARQFGRMVGLKVKDCDVSPTDVMCGDFPQDSQWELENKNKWFSVFDNQLETIMNIPDFYKENFSF